MNYIDKIAMKIGDQCGMQWPNEEEKRLLRMYAVLCRAKGTDTTAEDVHDAWTAWRIATLPHHQSAIPFSTLSEEVQVLDDPYVEAIQLVAVGLTD